MEKGGRATSTEMVVLQAILVVLLSLSTVKGEGEAISVNKRYHQRHQKSSINGSTCTGVDFKDDEYDAVYCDPEYDEACDHEDKDEKGYEPACHISRLNDTLVDEEVAELMATNSTMCCPFYGFIEKGTCDGKDKIGNKTIFENVDICVEQTGEKEIQIVQALPSCPLHCNLVHDFLDLAANPIKDGVLTYKNKKYENFCLALKCDEEGERFQPYFEACGDCIENTADMNKNISDRIGKPNCC